MGLVSDWGPSDRKRELIAFWEKVAPILVLAVERSFTDAGMRDPTRSEKIDRTTKAKKIVEQLRFDLKWSFPRIRDRLPAILRATLLGDKNAIDRELSRDKTDDQGNTTVTYMPDVASEVAQPVASATTEAKLTAEFGDEESEAIDLADDDGDGEIAAQETDDDAS